MNECYSCGVSGEKAILYEGVHKSFGVVKVCRKCYFKEKLPLVETKKVNTEELDKRLSVRERLSNMAGIKVEKKKEEFKRHVFTPEDIGLKDIVEKNFKKNVQEGPRNIDDLVDNYNWVITRKRRSMKITREELARNIMEQPVVIESLENGHLPRDYTSLLKKVENYLQVSLFKDSKKQFRPEEIITESKIPSGILISELKEKTAKEKSFGRGFFSRKEEKPWDEGVIIEDLNLEKIKQISGEPSKNDRKSEENKKNINELSDEEINDLIFGRK